MHIHLLQTPAHSPPPPSSPYPAQTADAAVAAAAILQQKHFLWRIFCVWIFHFCHFHDIFTSGRPGVACYCARGGVEGGLGLAKRLAHV